MKPPTNVNRQPTTLNQTGRWPLADSVKATAKAKAKAPPQPTTYNPQPIWPLAIGRKKAKAKAKANTKAARNPQLN